MRKRVFLALASALFLAIFAYAKNPDAARQFFQQIPKDQKIRQALNRLTFGPRPGDVEKVRAIGLKKWVELQLHPGQIPENPVLTAKLKEMDTLTMSSEELVRNYPTPQMVKQMVAGQMPFPSDPDRRMLIRKLVARFQQKQGQDAVGAAAEPPELQPLREMLQPEQIRALRTGTAQARFAAFNALPKDKQDDVIEALPNGLRQAMFAAASPAVRRKIEMANGPQQVVARDLMESKLMRAVYSNRQLDEVLADFWFNHFNVYLDKGADHYLITAYERDAIRPHVLGKFRDLLEATAKSPAMLFYLDNWQSVGPNTPQARRAGNQPRRGLNENYGRELMELHTLGVEGGYTQKDVTEVARCFTGWTIEQPQRGGKFFFNPRMHDNGEKTVLGVTIPAGGGIEDGEKVLDILAHHPSTAHFISKKLAMRFVADEPPASLVDRMSQTFLKSDGDLREVMRTMLNSKEFWSRGRLPEQAEVAARDGGQRGAGGEWRCGFCVCADQPGGAARRAVIPQNRAHRIFELEPGMAQFGGAAGAHELRAATGGQQSAGRQGPRSEGARREGNGCAGSHGRCAGGYSAGLAGISETLSFEGAL